VSAETGVLVYLYHICVTIIIASITLVYNNCVGNMMTFSYSVGLTSGSAVAYLLNSWLGPYSSADPCQQLNSTSAAITPWNNLTLPHGLHDLPSSLFPGWRY